MALQVDRADSSLGDGLGILNRIPEEIRLKVFKSLVPDHLPIGTDSDLPLDVVDSRQTLLNLCFTSKKCCNLALPFLYKYVIITNYTQMASLLVCLMYNKERRAWIHRLAVLEEFQLEGYDGKTLGHNWDFVVETIDWLKEFDSHGLASKELDTFNAVNELLPQLKRTIENAPERCEEIPDSEEEDYTLEDFHWHLYETDLTTVHYGLLQLLIRMQTNIKDILIVTWPAYDHDLQICPEDSHSRTMSQFRLDPTRPSPENPLKSLISIRRQSEPNRAERFNPDPLAPEYLGSKDWEFLRDDGVWFFDYYLDSQGWPRPRPPPRDLTIFSHVTDLGLYKSWTHPAQLRVILGSCKSLKVLCYTTNATRWSDKFRPILSTDEDKGIPVPTLQQALEEVRGTLKELRLGWSRLGHILTADEEEAVTPHRVDISDFPHLIPGKVDIDRCFDARSLSD